MTLDLQNRKHVKLLLLQPHSLWCFVMTRPANLKQHRARHQDSRGHWCPGGRPSRLSGAEAGRPLPALGSSDHPVGQGPSADTRRLCWEWGSLLSNQGSRGSQADARSQCSAPRGTEITDGQSREAPPGFHKETKRPTETCKRIRNPVVSSERVLYRDAYGYR